MVVVVVMGDDDGDGVSMVCLWSERRYLQVVAVIAVLVVMVVGGWVVGYKRWKIRQEKLPVMVVIMHLINGDEISRGGDESRRISLVK